MARYVFWIVTESGEEVRWPGLTLNQARNMYKWTNALRIPLDSYGWEELQ